ncbi:hypothetical protein [Bordetella sp. 2513F-2]
MSRKVNASTRTDQGAVVVCTGFHRSATSLTAQLMHAGGMNMGRRLVSPHLSNPDGHFEDIDVVAINDNLLAKVGSDWRFHDETTLPRPETSLRAIQGYVDRRDGTHGQTGWGVKDPRISLFLAAWNCVLGPRGRFLLVVRHWAGSIQSLLNRHSRVLVEQGISAGQDSRDEHLSFWLRPGLAARMWVAYSRRILEFAKQNEDRVLILPQPVLVNGFDLIEWMNLNWRVGLKQSTGVVKPNLLTDKLETVISDLVTPTLRSQMGDIWAQLLEMGCQKLNLKSDSTFLLPNWIDSKPDPLLQSTIEKISRLAVGSSASSSAEPEEDYTHIGETRKVESVRILLRRNATLTPNLLGELFSWLETHAPEDPMLWQEYGVRALKEGSLEQAEQAFMRSASTGRAPASLWLYFGQLYERTQNFSKAEYHYRESIRRNKKNTFFVITLAKLLVELARIDEALSLLDEHIVVSGHPALVILWMQLMTELNHYDQARHRIATLRTRFPEHDDEWRRLLALLELPLDALTARKSLNEVIRRRTKAEDLPRILMQVLTHVDSNIAFQDLAARFLSHWRGIFSSEDLVTALSR